MRTLAVVVALLLAGCTGPQGSDDSGPSEGPVGGAGPHGDEDGNGASDSGEGGKGGPGPDAQWPEGILWVHPLEERLVSEDGWGGPEVVLGGFDIRAGVLAFAIEDEIILRWPDGDMEIVRPEGLTGMGRVSLSPDASQAVVQGIDPARQGGEFENIDIFVVDLEDAAWARISELPANEESPEWSPDGTRIAYTSFDPDAGIDIHIVEPDGTPARTIRDGGGIHLAWSPDSTQILEPGLMRIFDAQTGKQLADLRAAATAGLEDAGFALAAQYEGQAGRGTFPLDGDWNPDGTRIVFDGAVAGVEPGIVVATIGTDGTGFELVAGPIHAAPEAVNMFSFSPANPLWR